MAVGWQGSRIGVGEHRRARARRAGRRAAAAALPRTRRSGAHGGAAAQSRSAGGRRRREDHHRGSARGVRRRRRSARNLAVGPAGGGGDGAARHRRGARRDPSRRDRPGRASTSSATRRSLSVRRAARWRTVRASELAPGAEAPLPVSGGERICRAPGRRPPRSVRRCATTLRRWCRRSPSIRSGASSRRPAAACRLRCCRTARLPAPTGLDASRRRLRRCSTGSVMTAASRCGCRAATRSRGCRPMRWSS